KSETWASFARRSARGCMLGKSARRSGRSMSGSAVFFFCAVTAGDFVAVWWEVLGGAASRFTHARQSRMPLSQVFIGFKYVIHLATVPSRAGCVGNSHGMHARLSEFDASSMLPLAFRSKRARSFFCASKVTRVSSGGLCGGAHCNVR